MTTPKKDTTHKEETKEKEIGAKCIEYVKTPLIDVIKTLSPYTPEERISKWKAKFAAEDLDYLIDLMIIPRNAIVHSRFSTRLYGELLRIRELPMVQMKVTVPKHEETDETNKRKAYEGIYVDIGDRLSARPGRLFVKASDRGGIKDLSQKIIYCGNNHWRFYVVSNSDKGHYMMISNESIETHFEKMTWSYYSPKQEKNVPIKVNIKTWNI